MEPAGRPAVSFTPKVDPHRWVDDHGDCLYRYALVRVRTPEVAEDLVQETLLVAVRSKDNFAGRSSERSWLVGILKNKIIDYYRKLGRETSFTDLEFLEDEYSHKFVEQGFWNHHLGPHEWRPEADEVMHKGEFWQTMRDCLSKLPQRVADVFMLGEMDNMPSKEICKTLSISESNLWVMLHRARMALRECLLNMRQGPAVKFPVIQRLEVFRAVATRLRSIEGSAQQQSTKKSADLHQAAESSVEICCSEDRSPAHRPFWSRHLADSNGRLPNSVSRITPDDTSPIDEKPEESRTDLCQCLLPSLGFEAERARGFRPSA